MEEWDDKFFVSLVKKRRYDDMEGVEDSSTCVTALASIEKITVGPATPIF